ncbi:alpha-hydroxy acid oxidase [Orrella sp. 11846]|uniref:alpha-hydroxy acid oxidase n=1 Tax=Orrella sp. 11846 TaxID=3409913 RepID=UPI003B5B1399
MSIFSLRRVQNIENLRQLARRRLPRAVFDFYDGGAEDELTMKFNRQAFDEIQFIPRLLRNVSEIDLEINLFGSPCALPMMVGPTGAPGFGWPRAEIPLARACAKFGIPFTLSTSATVSIEELAQEAPGRLWFQAYVFRDKPFLKKLITRAKTAQYETLVITVDMPVGGKRERDFRNDFGLPFRYTVRNTLDFARHPGWVWQQLTNGLPEMANLRDFVPQAANLNQVASSVGKSYDPALDWDELKRLRDLWPGCFIVKGLLHPDDARQAKAIGCDAIMVSNHGGRQLDGAISALDALPAIREAVGEHFTLILDSGIRRGRDVMASLASGADLVLLGRATLYGVCAAGQAGAEKALEILSDELQRTMRLSGVTTLEEIGPELLHRR